jgi:predicted protein tyrosine phosphatase
MVHIRSIHNGFSRHKNLGETPQTNSNTIYIGDYESPFLPSFLQDSHIGLVVNCAKECHDPWDYPSIMQNPLYQSYQDISYVRLDLEDDHEQDVLSHLDVLNKMHETLKNKNVLVHCAAGISRSVTIVCAYVILYEKKTPREALDYIQQSWPHAQPNAHFFQQLQIFANRCQ